jgi:methylenetetrahydrofolate reductase (NADPH)
MQDRQDGETQTTFSFEFFPPRSDEALETLMETLQEIEPLEPSFVSVTCRAGTHECDRTRRLVQRFHDDTTLTSIPHLTCRGRSREDVRALLEQYFADGVKGILALAGDPIEGDEVCDDYKYAADLVRDIQQFNAEITDPARRFQVGVAGFPEGHPDTPNRLEEMAHLKAKVDEGADWICTQLFFDNRDYYDYRERCELESIDVPILAGIMPVTSWKAYEKMAELAGGVRYPASLIRSLRRCDDAESVARVGVHWATEQCRDLLDHQVDGLHFYTLNRSRATLEIYRSLGVKTSRALAASA